MLTLADVSKSFGGDELFSGVSLQVNRGDRIGLIGPNGAGKSTLFAILLAREDADTGSVQLQRGMRVGFLPQESESVGSETVLELALSGQVRDEDFDGADEARAKKILRGLAFRERDFNRAAREFSGGWIMRAHLARLLVTEPDLLLLDEPTNHLDLESVQWFQNYLTGYPGAILVISHDRAFLNAIVRRVVEFDRKQLTSYTGTYDDFVAQKQARREQQLAAYKNQQREIDRLQTFIDRFGAKATKASQAKSKQKQIDRIERIEAPEGETPPMRFRFPQPARGGARVVRLEHVGHSYGPQVVYTDLSLEIERGQRTVLVGPNGAGKSTLLKLLAGVLPVQTGQRELGTNVELGYFSQHRTEMFQLERTVLEEALDLPVRIPEQTVRTALGAFLFSGDDVFKPVRVLSGGEKSRLALAKLLLHPPNFLIMDEPTTHLDMRSIEALMEALRQYSGTLIFVSHDVYFIRAMATSVFHVRGGDVQFYPGGYDYYLEKTQVTSAEQGLIAGVNENHRTQSAASDESEDPREKKRREAEERQERYRIRRERENRLGVLEQRIIELEERQKEIVAAFESGETTEAGQLSRELNSVLEELGRLTSEWEELSDAIAAA
jgi:ATP-binding cassette, subfamily F, member 3